ncbi:MAG: OmpA family protein [Bacteroidales bacterium]
MEFVSASFVELDKVVELLKVNPTLNAELSSHTDRRGSDKYSLKLSQLCAQSAVDYLTEKGIDKIRIKAVGYGKKQLLNTSTDCAEEQHCENRRTEISLPGFIQSI